MEAEFSINDEQLRSVFSNLERPTSSLMKAIAAYLSDEAKLAIKNQTSPDGKAFAPLSPAYAIRKSKDKRTRRTGILQQSGQMFDSIAADSTENTALLKTNRPVGSFDLGSIHNLGAPRRNIPARRFFPITDNGDLLPDAEEEIRGLISDFFSL